MGRVFYTSGSHNFLGRSNHEGFEKPLSGTVRDLQIHRHALSPADVLALVGGKQPPSTPSCAPENKGAIGRMQFRGRQAPLCCSEETGMELEVLVDVNSVEVFDLNGPASFSECFIQDRSRMPLAVR